ncbi:hypothetical protein [Nonomuraea jabiensis]|uniref:hypothetical protein n=1 Tax=Nonomuraea jabiensis TaxID=882448 RepID=UPI0036BECCCE
MADVVAFLALGADAGVVEVGAQVDEASVGVGQQVPDDGEDGAADGDDGSLLAAAAGDAAVAFAEEGVGLARRDCCFAQNPGQIRVAVAGGAPAFLAAGQGEPELFSSGVRSGRVMAIVSVLCGGESSGTASARTSEDGRTRAA